MNICIIQRSLCLLMRRVSWHDVFRFSVAPRYAFDPLASKRCFVFDNSGGYCTLNQERFLLQCKKNHIRGPTFRSKANFYVEAKWFLCQFSASFACIWNSRPGNTFHVMGSSKPLSEVLWPYCFCRLQYPMNCNFFVSASAGHVCVQIQSLE